MKFVGGAACLDFVNTVGAWSGAGTVLRDKIASYEDLLRWSLLAGLMTEREARRLARHAAGNPRAARATLARAIRLRAALYRIFTGVLEGRGLRSRDLRVVREELAVARAQERLAVRSGAFLWTWYDRGSALGRVLWPVARSAGDLLTCGDLGRLRRCRGGECGWMFLDTSRNHGRKWCDMKDCGNLAKVRRFRQRERERPAS
jgi:predicted RNA-binding Zn ribbon-like protein